MAMEQSSDRASKFSTEATRSELKMGSKNLFSSKHIYKSKQCFGAQLIMSVSARFVRKAFFLLRNLEDDAMQVRTMRLRITARIHI